MTHPADSVIEWLKSERDRMTDIHQIAHVNNQIHKLQLAKDEADQNERNDHNGNPV